jgi:hypothetical protein
VWHLRAALEAGARVEVEGFTGSGLVNLEGPEGFRWRTKAMVRDDAVHHLKVSEPRVPGFLDRVMRWTAELRRPRALRPGDVALIKGEPVVVESVDESGIGLVGVEYLLPPGLHHRQTLDANRNVAVLI